MPNLPPPPPPGQLAPPAPDPPVPHARLLRVGLLGCVLVVAGGVVLLICAWSVGEIPNGGETWWSLVWLLATLAGIAIAIAGGIVVTVVVVRLIVQGVADERALRILLAERRDR